MPLSLHKWGKKGPEEFRALSKVTPQMSGRAGTEIWLWDSQVHCATAVSLLTAPVSGQTIIITRITTTAGLTPFRPHGKHLHVPSRSILTTLARKGN